MKFNPEKYCIPDEQMKPFIDPEEIWGFINNILSSPERVHGIISKSLAKQRLNFEDVAVLFNTNDAELIEEIKEGSRLLKRTIYGNRIVFCISLS